jgi:hypothetical protein
MGRFPSVGLREKEVYSYTITRSQLTYCPCRLISYPQHIHNSSSSLVFTVASSSSYVEGATRAVLALVCVCECVCVCAGELRRGPHRRC